MVWEGAYLTISLFFEIFLDDERWPRVSRKTGDQHGVVKGLKGLNRHIVIPMVIIRADQHISFRENMQRWKEGVGEGGRG